MTRLPDFRLETYFSRWEFAARHHLTASDAQTMPMAELLALADEQDREAWETLSLGYTETFRFTATLGEAPMSYLTGWRLALAADQLRQHPESTIGADAHRVGYGSAFALSTAFKRAYGVSPQSYRAA